MVGKTPRIRKTERQRFETIKLYCGCLPCLLTGHPDRHTSIEHVTDRGHRIGTDSSQHEATIGLCEWHHYAVCVCGRHRQEMAGDYGPSLATGRHNFEEHFGDERHVLLPAQDFMLELFEQQPWQEYNVPRDIARKVRIEWIALNHAAETRTIRK